MNIETVIHRWANQIKPSGKSGNVYYEGRTLYSYGSHFVLGHWLKHPKLDGGESYVVVLNTETYSQSTGRHQNYTSRSIPSGAKVLRLPLTKWRSWVRYGEGLHHPLSPEGLMVQAHEELSRLAGNVSARSPRKAIQIQERAEHLIEAMGRLSEIFGVEPPGNSDLVALIFSDEVRAAIEKLRQANIERAAAVERKRAMSRAEQRLEIARRFKPDCTKEEADAVIEQAWRDGRTSNRPNTEYHLLRKRFDKIETSLGLSLTLHQLAGAYQRLHRGGDVAGYTVISADDKLIAIGCHRILRSEIDNLISQLAPEERKLVGA